MIVKCSHIQDNGGRRYKIKMAYPGRGSSDIDEIWRRDAVRPSRPPRLKFEIFKMAAAAMWKNRKMSYLGRRSINIDKIWHHDAAQSRQF